MGDSRGTGRLRSAEPTHVAPHTASHRRCSAVDGPGGARPAPFAPGPAPLVLTTRGAEAGEAPGRAAGRRAIGVAAIAGPADPEHLRTRSADAYPTFHEAAAQDVRPRGRSAATSWENGTD